jgi:hypothetical protein
MASNLVKWGSFDIGVAEEERKAVDAETASTSVYITLKEGDTTVRFLPPPVGVQNPFMRTHRHFIRLANLEHPVVFNCPRMLAKQPCPVCEQVDKLKASGNRADYKKAGSFLPRLYIFANVIDRAQEERGPLILRFGKTIFDQLMEIRTDLKKGGDYTNPEEEGFDIIITRKGSGMQDTEYSVYPCKRNSELGDLSWIDKQHNLVKEREVLTYDEIVDMLKGENNDNERSSNRREAAGGRGRGGGRGRSVQDDAQDAEVWDAD